MHFDVQPFCLCRHSSGSRGRKSLCLPHARCNWQSCLSSNLPTCSLYKVKILASLPRIEKVITQMFRLVSINHLLTGANPNHWAVFLVILQPRGLVSKSFVLQSWSSDNQIFFKSFFILFFFFVSDASCPLCIFLLRLSSFLDVGQLLHRNQPQWAVHCLGVTDSHTDPFVCLSFFFFLNRK